MTIPSALATVVACLLLAGCRSPFGAGPETGPPEDPAAVGTGVHAWPLYESVWEGEEHRTDVLWPAVSLRTAAADGALTRADILFPLFLKENYADGSRIGLRPLFDVETRERVDGTVEDVDLLFPLVKWRSSPEKDLLRILPVYSRERTASTSETVVFPFWWEETTKWRSHRFLIPFWGRQTEARGNFRKTWFAPPLFALGSDDDGTRTEWDALFPLLHGETREDGEAFRFLPFASFAEKGDEGHLVLFPFWWDFHDTGESFRMLFPVYGRSARGADEEMTSFGGPLLVMSRDGDERSWDPLWPILHYGEDGDDWDARAFPVLWLERSENAGRTVLWPLYGYDRRHHRTQHSLAWPFFTWDRKDDGAWEVDAPFPLIAFRGGGDKSGGRVFPLFDVESTESKNEGSVLWQGARWKSEGDDSRFTVLWRLVDSGSTAHRGHFALNPLFRTESNDRGDHHWSVLMGLVARTSDASGSRWRWLWFL